MLEIKGQGDHHLHHWQKSGKIKICQLNHTLASFTHAPRRGTVWTYEGSTMSAKPALPDLSFLSLENTVLGYQVWKPNKFKNDHCIYSAMHAHGHTHTYTHLCNFIKMKFYPQFCFKEKSHLVTLRMGKNTLFIDSWREIFQEVKYLNFAQAAVSFTFLSIPFLLPPAQKH